MQWILDKQRPVCPQLCEQVCLHIALGDIQPGERLYSVRETALAAGVNPNTVQRAYEQLEQEGILHSVRGSGWYVADDITPARQTLDAIRREKTHDYIAAMAALGLTADDIKTYIKEWNE